MSTAITNPLRDLHDAAGAEFQQYGEVEIVATFNEPQAEYSAIHTGCGMMDLPQRACVEVTGPERLKFLNNLLTNELVNRETKQPLPAGKGVYAYLLDRKTGRIICDLNVLELGERTIVEVDGRMVDPLLKQLEQYHFSEKVQWQSRAGQWHELALYGKTAPDLLRRVMGGLPGLDNSHDCAPAKLIGQDVTVWRDDPTGQPGYHLIVPTSSAAAIWSDLFTRLGVPDPVQYSKLPLRPIGWAAFNATRIEAGRAIFGIDFDDSILPLELSLTPRGMSFTKGCYPGQEIVARMVARKQVARQLVGLKMQEDALPVSGTAIYDGSQTQIGGVMSSTVSPILSNACIALGYVKRPHFELGKTVMIPAEGKMATATVVETPFVKAPGLL